MLSRLQLFTTPFPERYVRHVVTAQRKKKKRNGLSGESVYFVLSGNRTLLYMKRIHSSVLNQFTSLLKYFACTSVPENDSYADIIFHISSVYSSISLSTNLQVSFVYKTDDNPCRYSIHISLIIHGLSPLFFFFFNNLHDIWYNEASLRSYSETIRKVCTMWRPSRISLRMLASLTAILHDVLASFPWECWPPKLLLFSVYLSPPSLFLSSVLLT